MAGIMCAVAAMGAKPASSGSFTAGLVGGANNARGYDPSNSSTLGAIGSGLSPATLLDGYTLAALYRIVTTAPSDGTVFRVSGFSADPGAAYFRSLTCNSLSVNASAATYSYAGGVAQWAWTGDVFSMPSSGSVSFTVTY